MSRIHPRGVELAWDELLNPYPAWTRYALSVAIFAFALALRFAILPVESGLAYLTFYPSSVIVFFLCGTAPGIVFLALSAVVATGIFTPPYWEFALNVRSLIPIVFFTGSCALVGALVRRAKNATAHLRMLYEKTPAMLHSCDAQGRLLSVSDVWLSTLGYQREEVLGHLLTDFMPAPGHTPDLPLAQHGFLLNGETHQLKHQDGTLIDVTASTLMERNERGEATGSLAVLEDVRDKLLNARARHELSSMLGLVLDNVPARISYWDTSQHNRFANKPFAEWFGRTQADVVGRSLQDITGEAWATRIQPAVAEGLSGRPVHLETLAPGPDGKKHDLDLHFVPDRHEGLVRGLFVFVQDVSAQRAAERALVEREKIFRTLIEGVHDYAIYMLDASGHIKTWSSNAQHHKGYKAEEVIGQHFRLFFTPKDATMGQPERELAIAEQKGIYEAEAWRMRSNGEHFWASVMLSALRDEQGRLTGFAKITRDLTERTRQRDLLARVTEVAPYAMLMVNAQGKITMVNAKLESLFGHTRSDLLGQSVDMLVPLGARASHPERRNQYTHNRPQTRPMAPGRRLKALHRDGHEFSVDIGLSPIDTADGPCILAAVFDTTEREQQQATLEQTLAEKETLLKEVYHRVKNNLQVVQSLMNLQKNGLPEGTAREACDDNVQRVRAMALVHEKLYQSGNLTQVSLQNYTADLLAQIAEASGLNSRRIALHADIAPLKTGLDGAVPFGLLLTELISNCVKHGFVDGRSGDVWVRLEPQSQGVLLTITDNGIGLAEGFDVAAQTASMGLQLATGLARQLGGELCAKHDKGAVFSALLTRL